MRIAEVVPTAAPPPFVERQNLHRAWHRGRFATARPCPEPLHALAAVSHGADVSRDESEFRTPEMSVRDAVAAHRKRAATTDEAVRSTLLTQSSTRDGWRHGKRLRRVLLHLINETARHTGHADATRELLDGTTCE
jgi:hypothetical protein